jgi:hypothetical protein
MSGVRVVRVLAGLILFLALAGAVLVLLAVTWSPGFVMRIMAPRFGRWLPRPGTVTVKILPPVDTSGWSPATLDQHVAEIRSTMAHQLELMRCYEAA